MRAEPIDVRRAMRGGAWRGGVGREGGAGLRLVGMAAEGRGREWAVMGAGSSQEAGRLGVEAGALASPSPQARSGDPSQERRLVAAGRGEVIPLGVSCYFPNFFK